MNLPWLPIRQGLAESKDLSKWNLFPELVRQESHGPAVRSQSMQLVEILDSGEPTVGLEPTTCALRKRRSTG